MKFYAITYDLRQPGRKYNEFYEAIKALAGSGNWQHPMESFWMISLSRYSAEDANSLFEKLRQHIDPSDSIMVAEMEMADYQGWMPKSFWDWVKEQKDKQ